MDCMERRLGACVLSLALAAAACGGGGGNASQAADGSKPAQVIAIDGSSTVFPITEAVAEEFQKANRGMRVTVGISRTGAPGSHFSGDLFLAFSTANRDAAKGDETVKVTALPNGRMDPLFEATVQATEEAIVNALVAAKTMVGRDDNRAEAMPHERVREILRKHGRLVDIKKGE